MSTSWDSSSFHAEAAKIRKQYTDDGQYQTALSALAAKFRIPPPVKDKPAAYATRASAALNNNANSGTATPVASTSKAIPAPTLPTPVPSATVTTKPVTLQAHVVGQDESPLPPFTPLHDTLQAGMTTYPSRVKLGTTNLMQPIPIKNVKPEVLTYVQHGGRRNRSAINYAEVENLDPEPDLDASDLDEAETQNLTARGRQMYLQKRQAEKDAAAAAAGSNRSTPQPQAQPEPRLPKAPAKSFLGKDVPGNLVIAEPAKRARHVYPSEQNIAAKAQQKATLVPIRIDLDTETHHIRDCFVWDLGEAYMTTDLFATIFCEDVGIPIVPYREQISTSIKAQIEEHTGVAEVNILSEEQEKSHTEADLRVIVNIDVQIQTIHLVDRIEWDLSSSLTPEHFSAQLCADLGLTGEAAPIISHAIHDELLRLKKDCLEMGLVGREEVGGRGPKKMEGVWREWHEVKHFGPRIEELSVEDLDALELERERAGKRQKRNATIQTGSRPSRKR